MFEYISILIGLATLAVDIAILRVLIKDDKDMLKILETLVKVI